MWMEVFIVVNAHSGKAESIHSLTPQTGAKAHIIQPPGPVQKDGRSCDVQKPVRFFSSNL